MKNTYTFNPDNSNWENASKSKDFVEKWTFENHPSNEEMIKILLPHMEDKGMFEDIVEWLRKDAPKKLRGVLNGLRTERGRAVLSGTDRRQVLYEYLCRVVYELDFRVNEVVEGRMILGTNNQWVKKYFEDFPLRTELAH